MVQQLSTELRYLTMVSKSRMAEMGGHGADLQSRMELRQQAMEKPSE